MPIHSPLRHCRALLAWPCVGSAAARAARCSCSATAEARRISLGTTASTGSRTRGFRADDRGWVPVETGAHRAVNEHARGGDRGVLGLAWDGRLRRIIVLYLVRSPEHVSQHVQRQRMCVRDSARDNQRLLSRYCSCAPRPRVGTSSGVGPSRRPQSLTHRRACAHTPPQLSAHRSRRASRTWSQGHSLRSQRQRRGAHAKPPRAHARTRTHT